MKTDLVSEPNIEKRSNFVLAEIERNNASLSEEDRKLKYGKMACSAYRFYRGTNHLFWADFAGDERLQISSNCLLISQFRGKTAI
ncbi:MAG: DUF2252 domain-containing protein [Moorea sp. SIO2B7]|nr:DUF2252 domain-containing protein [Moorena sp. SIO2B7]